MKIDDIVTWALLISNTYLTNRLLRNAAIEHYQDLGMQENQFFNANIEKLMKIVGAYLPDAVYGKVDSANYRLK